MRLLSNLVVVLSIVITTPVITTPVFAQILPDFTAIVEDQSAAVVKITTVTHAKTANNNPYEQYGVPPNEVPEIFRHFFERRDQPQQRESQSLGSGFIISDNGYVVTNNHVIADADEITVRMLDRREFVAEVVGSDERSDIALLKIDAKDLPAVEFGESSDLRVGEWVLAIGSPFGLDYSVSAGIVSAIGRSIPNGQNGNYVPFIQTDVAINPGNSGGPLFNLKGEVVGINSQIYSRSGGFMGLSFAIPIDVAMNVSNQLKQSGRVNRGWLGVRIQDVTRELAESFDMDKPHGALISQIIPNSPAEKAGLLTGDIIIEFNGNVVNRSSSLPPLVGSTNISDKARVKIIRNKKTKKI